MRRTLRTRVHFFILGFCTCLLLTGIVRFLLHHSNLLPFREEQQEARFYPVGSCKDCQIITVHHWRLRRLSDKMEVHLASAKALGINPIESEEDLKRQIGSLCRSGRLVELKDNSYYQLKKLTHSYPYLVPEAYDLLQEIGARFQARLKEVGIAPYYILISSVLRTGESQSELTHSNMNATRAVSAHEYGTTFDISYKEFLPLHGKPAPEGYCRHDMLRYPLAEVLTALSEEGRCLVVQEVKQACYHVTVSSHAPHTLSTRIYMR